MKNVLILNSPGPDDAYINRDLMGGMGQKTDFGRDFKTKVLSKLKGNFIHIPVVQLVYAATILAENGFNVKVIDAPNENINLEKTIEAIKDFVPDYIIMEVSSSCIIYERDIVAKKLKELFTNTIIITTGDIITHDIALFKSPFDISIFGEVESVILDICTGNKELPEINGIIYFKNGEIIKNPDKELLSNEELGALPFPRWDLFPINKYVYYPQLNKKPVALIQSTRGCPYSCGYCSYPANQGIKWRFRSAKNIVDEIEHDIKFGFKSIFFRDPLFTLDRKRIEEMCDIIKERNIKFIFCFETRPELLTKELLDRLYEIGCRAINLGIEDVHSEILQKILRKPADIEKIKEIVYHAEKIGIKIGCFFILGLPGSTKETIKETVDFSKELNSSFADYKIATPFPGTYLYKLAKQNNWLVKEEYNLINGYSATMKISEDLPPEYINEVCKDAFNSYYTRFNYLKRDFLRGSIFDKANMIFKTIFN